MFWNRMHPERHEQELRQHTWQQAAELAVIAPQQAAKLLVSYEQARDVLVAANIAFGIETQRAEHLTALRQQVGL